MQGNLTMFLVDERCGSCCVFLVKFEVMDAIVQVVRVPKLETRRETLMTLIKEVSYLHASAFLPAKLYCLKNAGQIIKTSILDRNAGNSNPFLCYVPILVLPIIRKAAS